MSTINPAEIAQFNAQAHAWWDESGPFKPLHKINPVRLAFLRENLMTHFQLSEGAKRPLDGLRILDVGCGGGLLCEPLARLGATVTGIDAGEENIAVARQHAIDHNLSIDYRCTTAEDLAASSAMFDVVTALEIVEHVDNVALFMKSCCTLIKPEGLLFLSTLNKTVKSYALGIVAAEYLLKWVPKGTHQWQKFLEPFELSQHLSQNGFAIDAIKGIAYNPLTNSWDLGSDLDVNYILAAKQS